ncbi:MAG: hypothetical protein ACR2MB_10310, partial [Acidimicrobiales bacterium]
MPERHRVDLPILAVMALVAVAAAAGLAVGYLVGHSDDGAARSSTGGTEAGEDQGTPAHAPPATGATLATVTTPATVATPPTVANPATVDSLGSGQPITIAFAGDMNFEGVLRSRLDADPSTAVGPFADVLRG